MVFSEKTGELLCFGGRVLQRTTRIEDFSLDELQTQSPIRSNYGNFYKWVSLNFAKTIFENNLMQKINLEFTK
jgi:hypothetical protein